MIKEDFECLLWHYFGHKPTKGQQLAGANLASFAVSGEPMQAFLLAGHAGTGKTSLIAALVKVMEHEAMPVILLAPTGRAAKVFASYAGVQAYTIHKKIYREDKFDNMQAHFAAGYNAHKGALFIVDEASMIANQGGGVFGTGRLLDDLISFVFSAPGCRLLVVGDTAQLPPVGETLSPALDPYELHAYGLQVTCAALTEVVRQVAPPAEGGESVRGGILYNATRIRAMLAEGSLSQWPRIRAAGFADVRVVPAGELIEALEDCYYHCSVDDTIVVTRSNKRAGRYNNGIRARILDYEGELCGGDRVIVVKNNYTVLPPVAAGDPPLPTDFIANGDAAIVRRLRNVRELYGFRFADAELMLPDYDNMELSCTVLLDVLQSDTPALPQEEQDRLFKAVWDDYPEIRSKKARLERVRQDPYYGALQLKYGYAVTCHKAQGGQWMRVFVDAGYLTPDMLTIDYIRWLYTAVTRATDCLYLVNWPSNQIE